PAYLVPAERVEVIDLLRAHGVEMSQMPAARNARVERFAIDSTWVAEREFEQHHERTATGRYETVELAIPAGTWVVSTEQPLGRLVFALLEPRGDGGARSGTLLDRARGDAGRYGRVRRVHDGG